VSSYPVVRVESVILLCVARNAGNRNRTHSWRNHIRCKSWKFLL